jgi:P-type Ca2+ transporter type 2C
MFNALTCRSASHTALPIPGAPRIHLFSNKMFNLAVSGSLVGQMLVIYFPFLQAVFQTEALYLTDLFWLLCLTSTVFWVDEARKWWFRRQRIGKETIEEKLV